ncbi:MAG: hypothetical protein P8N02_05910, partial [Actinomycetota bacterium]|nr:hypothetical protein [Actinomycetota bacterium]
MNPAVDTANIEGQHTEASESVIVEAPTVEAALEAVTLQLGRNCHILGIEKVSRGGIAGFFGKETFQVEVRRPSALPDPTSIPSPNQALTPTVGDDQTGARAAALEAVDRVLGATATTETSTGDQTFGDVLRSELATRAAQQATPAAEPVPFDGIDLTELEPAAPDGATPDPTPTGSDNQALSRLRDAAERQRQSTANEPTQDEPTAEVPATPQPATQTAAAVSSAGLRTTGPGEREAGIPIFTADHLVRSGMPFSFVVQLGDLSPLDDVGRLVQLAGALEPWCGPLPRNDSLVVGLRADRLAGALNATVHGPRDPL